ncbi:MAG TPA: extracellular solute-binding protein [Rhodopila sp.]|nr:extracellular solute-binding protein [Rhodopila sp.]
MGRAFKVTRRGAIKLAAATALPLVHIRTAGAAGHVKIGFWDHWVPGGNNIMQKQVDAWADKNKVSVEVDFITGNGNKLSLTGAAEAQAKTGHDVMTFYNWDVHNYADALEPIDDVMTRLIAANGQVNKACTYLAKTKKSGWVAVPTSSGTQTKPPCARISWFRKHGLDLQAMYPAREATSKLAEGWTWEGLLHYAELAKKEDMTFGLGMGGSTNTDATDMHGALFQSFNASLVDSEGAMQLHTDAIKQVLEFAQRLVKFYPNEAVSFDDASNNRALISGKSALIFNPPSAWAVAKRDAPQVAADCWTFPAPSGPAGRFVPTASFFWGVYNFSQNKTAGKELVEYLMQRPQVEARCNAVDGYDLPPYAKMTDFKIWEEVEPPKGTVYNYPIRPWNNEQASLTASEAPPDVAVQIYSNAIHNQMLARLKEGQTIPAVIAWTQDQLSGFMR